MPESVKDASHEAPMLLKSPSGHDADTWAKSPRCSSHSSPTRSTAKYVVRLLWKKQENRPRTFVVAVDVAVDATVLVTVDATVDVADDVTVEVAVVTRVVDTVELAEEVAVDVSVVLGDVI